MVKDGAKSVGSDLARRAPNAVTLSFRDGLSPAKQAKFDVWYEAGDNAALQIGSWPYANLMRWNALAVVCCLFWMMPKQRLNPYLLKFMR